MTVKNHREAECATASGDDTDVEMGLETGQVHGANSVHGSEHEENLLGRVLAGTYPTRGLSELGRQAVAPSRVASVTGSRWGRG